MTSESDDQQFSSMQSTSEFGDSRRQLRQVECCVHGRPCAIASKLSRIIEERDRDLSTPPYSVLGSEHEKYARKREKRVISDESLSYGLNKQVERAALDVPLRKWNFGTTRSKTSSSSLEPINRQITETKQETAVLKRSSRELRTTCNNTKNNKENNNGNWETIKELFFQVLSGKADRQASLFRTTSMNKMKKGVSSEKLDNEYEMMRPPMGSGPILVPKSFPSEQSVITARAYNSVELAPSMEAYIGVLSPQQAEKRVIKPTSFKLYHMMPKIDSLNSVLPSLGLYIIYRSGKGEAYHFPIKEYRDCMDAKTRSRLMPLSNFQVQYGDPLAPRFFTLDALVNYYNVYVQLREVDGDRVADIFPVSEIGFNRISRQRSISRRQI